MMDAPIKTKDRQRFMVAVERALCQLEDDHDVSTKDIHKIALNGSRLRLRTIETVTDYLLAAYYVNHS